MPGGGVGIRLINGSSIVVDPKHFLIADDKIIISSTCISQICKYCK